MQEDHKYQLRKLVENKSKEGTECERIIGNRTLDLANFWARNPDIFHILGINAQIEWEGIDGEYNSREMKAFKAGLSVIPNFMQKCYEELELKKLPKNNEML